MLCGHTPTCTCASILHVHAVEVCGWWSVWEGGGKGEDLEQCVTKQQLYK